MRAMSSFTLNGFVKGEATRVSSYCKDNGCQADPLATKEFAWADELVQGKGYGNGSTHVTLVQPYLGAKFDLGRGYKVSDGHFERVSLLKAMLAPLAAEQTRVAEVSKVKTEAAEAARQRLLGIRSALGDIGKAAGLPPGIFSLDTSNTQRLNVVMMKMEEVLENVQAFRPFLPDGARVDALVVEARGLIDAQRTNRQEARLLRTDGSLESRKPARLERSLLTAMQYLSAQGLAAYPEDPVREPRYRLDHTYGNRTSKVADPGAKPTDNA